jgi:hypothetical protein
MTAVRLAQILLPEGEWSIPEGNGFLTSDPDHGMIEGSIIAALARTEWQHKVHLICAPGYSDPARNALLSRVKDCVSLMRPSPHHEKSVRLLKELAGQLLIGEPKTTQYTEPARWVAIGFGPDSPAPPWLKANLSEKSS